jgi:hypothetical protein
MVKREGLIYFCIQKEGVVLETDLKERGAKYRNYSTYFFSAPSVPFHA